MKKLLSIILALTMLLSMGTMVSAAYDEPVNPFVDVKKDAWYHDEVVKAVETGIINGKSETIFAPDDLLTYAEAIKLAACMNQVYTDGKVTLTGGDPWYKPYVDYCMEKGIISEEYNYDDNATRAGYMVIFANALPDSAFEEINNIPNGSILDVKTSATYAHYVYKMYRAGIVTGVDEKHNCNPEANIIRAEVATIISRMMDPGKRVKFSMSKSGGSIDVGSMEDDNDKEIINKTEENEDKDKEIINKTEENEDKDKYEDAEKDNTKQNTEEKEDEPINIAPEDPQIGVQDPTQTVDPGVSVTPAKPFDGGSQEYILDTPLTIHKQPEGSEAEEYGTKYELEVQVYGGKPPYTYEWQYNGYRNQKTKIENGDYVSGADTYKPVLSVEKENTLLGVGISCVITDSEGTKLTSETVKVYGPFSMPVEQDLIDSGKYTLIGRIADGIIRKGDKVSVERNGKIIATGTAEDLQMFNKSLDEGVKGDNIGIVFKLDKGVRPTSGDVVIVYKDTHVVDTSDVIN